MHRSIAALLSALLALTPLTATAAAAGPEKTLKPKDKDDATRKKSRSADARDDQAEKDDAKVEDKAALESLKPDTDQVSTKTKTKAKASKDADDSKRASKPKTTKKGKSTKAKATAEADDADSEAKPVAKTKGTKAKNATQDTKEVADKGAAEPGSEDPAKADGVAAKGTTPTETDSAAPGQIDRVESAKLAIWKRLFQENIPATTAAEGKYVTVAPVTTDFGGSVRNPITGAGPIVASVKQTLRTKDDVSAALAKSAWSEARAYAKKLGMEDKIPAGAGEEAPTENPGFLARVANDHFSKYGNRTFVVDVDQNGNGATQGLGDIQSVQVNNFQAKVATLLSAVRSAISPQLLKDVVKATQPKQIGTAIAAVTGVAGSIATANPIAMIAATAAAAVAVQSVTADIVKDVRAAIASRNQFQHTAVLGAAKWAQQTLKTDDPATAVETYREYQSQLTTAAPGTRPLTFEQFVKELQLQRL